MMLNHENTMANQQLRENPPDIATLDDLARLASYSFVDTLNCDPDADTSGANHVPRQVFSGHHVPVRPTAIEDPEYVTHSNGLFHELGFNDKLAQADDFVRMFSGDLSNVPEPMRNVGWACGYSLSIFGNEYYEQCPFQTGNGYGDGRAVSVLETVINGQRYEMQLKGGGPTPYCRGADGRAVLRSSIREFLAQEHMHALGVPTSRSLSLYVSKTETVQRPWYSDGSRSLNPDMLVSEPVAISTRVAPSFIRVGQLELFSRRARKNEHPKAMEELEKIVLHLIDREYSATIDQKLPINEKVILLAKEYRNRLTSLVANWIRVGYCQANFNSDNCAAGGFTLDYGPFGFCEEFNPTYQPWSGGGQQFSFLYQPLAAERNFHMFLTSLAVLLAPDQKHHEQLEEIANGFATVMQQQMEEMWAGKLGLDELDKELFGEMATLMIQTPVDYTIFFRELSTLPTDITPLKKSFYTELQKPTASTPSGYANDPEGIEAQWSKWLKKWNSSIDNLTDSHTGEPRCREEISSQMKLVNPKYSLRAWLVIPAYEQAAQGHYALVRELQDVMTQPYAEQSKEVEDKYYRLKPTELFEIGGVSHYSCSS